MKFSPTPIAGVQLVTADLMSDARGFFARLSCPQEFAGQGIEFQPLQTSLSRNTHLHTLRGMHYSHRPEGKLVRCVRGRVLDVVFDIRRDSPTFGASTSVILDADAANAIYIAPGLAHGFLTLQPDCDVLYQIDQIFQPGFDAGLRWNDPLFGFQWPAAPAVIGERDAAYPDFR